MRVAVDTNRYVDLGDGNADGIATNDMWIAALVLQHNLVLYARDKHFNYLPQLVRA